MTLPIAVEVREADESRKLEKRGIRLGEKDSNNEYRCRQWVMTPKGAGLLNGVQFYRPKYDQWYMMGAVQFDDRNEYFPLDKIDRLWFWKFCFMPGGFGLTGWVAWALIVVGIVLAFAMNTPMWGGTLIAAVMGGTWANFKRWLI